MEDLVRTLAFVIDGSWPPRAPLCDMLSKIFSCLNSVFLVNVLWGDSFRPGGADGCQPHPLEVNAF